MTQSAPMHILSISSNRADIGIIAPVWREIAASANLRLTVFLTGSHVADSDYGRAAVPDGCAVHVGGADIAGQDGLECRNRTGQIESACAELIAAAAPDLLLVVGDRIDMFPAVTASIPFNLPIAHIAGGDLSFGAVDERLRHAMTKLSHLHFVLNRHSAMRVFRMGEELDRIHIVGAPNLDTLKSVPVMTDGDFLTETGLPGLDRLRLVTVHPETNSRTPSAPLDAVLKALDVHKDPVLFTAPNTDPGSAEMLPVIDAFCAERPWVVYRANLGARLYANAMRRASTMIGNSSSGIIEAGLFGLSVINVGNRQEGREAADSVHHCAPDPGRIADLMARLAIRASGRPNGSLYGDGQAARRIRAVMEALPDPSTLVIKRFQTEPVPAFKEPWAHSTDI